MANKPIHRQNIELIVVQSNTRNELVGMIFGFIISILTIMSSCYLIYLDKWVSGIAGVIGTLVALVAVFIYGKHSQSKEKLLKNNSSSHRRHTKQPSESSSRARASSKFNSSENTLF